jgi:hypothetical protein
MLRHAQTNVQLWAQLAEQYPEEELSTAVRAYELAARLFSGRYRASGNTFVAHLIGTASILASIGASMNVVAGGLLHAAYPAGDFGTRTTGVSPRKRDVVRAAVGPEVERYVHRFAVLRWTPHTIPSIAASLDRLDPLDTETLVMRLANVLDVHLDRGILYYVHAEDRRRELQATGPALIDIAARVCPPLAGELRAVLAELATATVPAPLRRSWGAPRLLVPASCRRRASIAAYQWAVRTLDAVRGRARVRTRLRAWGILREPS